MAWDKLAELKRNAPWLFLVSLSARCPPGVSVPIDQTCPPAWMPIDLRVSTTGGWWTVTLSVHRCTGGHTECPPLGAVGSVTDRCPAGVRCCSPLCHRHLNQAEYSHIWCPLLYITSATVSAHLVSISWRLLHQPPLSRCWCLLRTSKGCWSTGL